MLAYGSHLCICKSIVRPIFKPAVPMFSLVIGAEKSHALCQGPFGGAQAIALLQDEDGAVEDLLLLHTNAGGPEGPLGSCLCGRVLVTTYTPCLSRSPVGSSQKLLLFCQGPGVLLQCSPTAVADLLRSRLFKLLSFGHTCSSKAASFHKQSWGRCINKPSPNRMHEPEGTRLKAPWGDAMVAEHHTSDSQTSAWIAVCLTAASCLS